MYLHLSFCLFQDKPQPPPEGRLRDATKGRSLIFNTIAMNVELWIAASLMRKMHGHGCRVHDELTKDQDLLRAVVGQ